MESQNANERLRTINAICQAAAVAIPSDPNYGRIITLFMELETLLLRPASNDPLPYGASRFGTMTTPAPSGNHTTSTPDGRQLEFMHMGGWAGENVSYGNGASLGANPSSPQYDANTTQSGASNVQGDANSTQYGANPPSSNYYGALDYYNYPSRYGP